MSMFMIWADRPHNIADSGLVLAFGTLCTCQVVTTHWHSTTDLVITAYVAVNLVKEASR